MIISASRRTDIPGFYMDWLLRRLEEGFVLVRNPVDARRVSRVPLRREDVDCLVFWSKNPAPLLGHLPALAPWPFYLQFTLNPYGADLESALPPLEQRVETFLRLAEALGPKRVVWRCSPLFFGRGHTRDTHLAFFEAMAARLEGATLECKLSFLEPYRKIQGIMRDLGLREGVWEDNIGFAQELRDMAAARGITLRACGHPALERAGIPPAHCIDAALVSELIGVPLTACKDPGQRRECSCAQSIDIGTYDTCPHGCAYCYANHAAPVVRGRANAYDSSAPMLCDVLHPDDVVTQRKVESQAQVQLHWE